MSFNQWQSSYNDHSVKQPLHLGEPGQQNLRTFWRTTGDPVSLPASPHVDPTLQINLVS